MSDKISFIIISSIIISIASTACAKENNPAFAKLETGTISVPNPFEPQLPVEEPDEIEAPSVTEIAESSAEDLLTDPYTFQEAQPPEIAAPPPIELRPLPSITISGIIWNSDRPQAIINETIVDIGDTVFEITITDIQKTSISGMFDGRVVTLQP